MIRRNPSGDLPQIHPSAYIDPTAIICGKVIVGPEVFIGPYAVIRADEVKDDGTMDPITIGAYCNIQDGVVIHSKDGAAVTIGERVSVAHRAIVHGPCTLEDDVFVGFNSVVFNCRIGASAIIRHNAVIEGYDIPRSFHVPSTTTIHCAADLAGIPQITAHQTRFCESVVRANSTLTAGYRALGTDF